MSISVLELFKIGIGPSSSHTVGPMKAAREFVCVHQRDGHLGQTEYLKIELFGSLALTGVGHGTQKAILLGLEGETPEGIDPAVIDQRISEIQSTEVIHLLGTRKITFIEEQDLVFHKDSVLPFHSNGMRFTAFDISRTVLSTQIYYSIGGGFILNEAQACAQTASAQTKSVPYPFNTEKSLTSWCDQEQLSIQEIMWANERAWNSNEEINRRLKFIWQTMVTCMERGFEQEGVLPGGLNVKRRAPNLYRDLTNKSENIIQSLRDVMDWVNLFALSVNEENAAGGRVVTAPTNGAAGVIPAVMRYYDRFVKPFDQDSLSNFLLTSGAIGILYKEGASISAAEMGCQGEIGVACSMAAAGLTSILGGSTAQITNAAEIGMEHHLGLTCDPIGGLVQIPCIERNTMGAIQAINSSNLALRGDGTHKVSLDSVIATMLQTGRDMRSEYKETSLGGLAVNVVAC